MSDHGDWALLMGAAAQRPGKREWHGAARVVLLLSPECFYPTLLSLVRGTKTDSLTGAN